MNRSKIIFGIFLIVALAQLIVPASRIWTYEQTIREGQLYKFRCAPFDPYDPFRGRYLQIQLAERTAPWQAGEPLPEYGQKVYATVAVKEDGFAYFARVSLQKPSEGDYLHVGALRVDYPEKDKLNLDLPWDRFYMNEKLAPEGERAFIEHSRGAQSDAYVTIRVRNGIGVIEDLYIGGRPIREFLRIRASQENVP